MSTLTALYHGRKAMLGLLKYKITKKRVPVRVSLLVTKYCNLKCFYCYVDVLNDKHVHEFTLQEIKNIIDEVYAAGCRWIHILGGEPLIRDDIGEIIDYMYSKGILTEITTNGFFIKKRIKELKKVDYFCISLDGNKESNDKSRGEGSFEKIIEGIECAVQNGLKVRIRATLCKKTMQGESLEFLTNFCKERNLLLHYTEPSVPGIEDLDSDFLLSEKETLDFYRGYKDLKKKGYPVVSSDFAMEYIDKWPLPDQTTLYKKDLPKIPEDSYYPCRLGRNQCFINADGNVYPCSKKWGDGKNIRDGGFIQAWNYLENLDCVSCKELGNIEQSAIMDLNPKAFFSALKNIS